MLVNFWTAFSAQAWLAFSTNTQTSGSQNVASDLLAAIIIIIIVVIFIIISFRLPVIVRTIFLTSWKVINVTWMPE